MKREKCIVYGPEFESGHDRLRAYRASVIKSLRDAARLEANPYSLLEGRGMTRREQRKFTRELCARVTREILALHDAGRIPEEWDGHELRALIAERFGQVYWMTMGRSRKAAYRNACLTNNLV